MTATAAMSGALAADLRAIVGERWVTDRRGELLSYESDALPGYRKRPSLAVFPASRDELIAVIRLFAEHGVAYVPRGAGTGLSGGALADGIALLGLQRLRRILSIDPRARTATVEPGVVNASLTAAASPHRLHYAPDPSSQTACTIGGNLAENAGGPHCLKYGVTLNHVCGATIMLPNAELVSLHLPPPDGSYDLLGAFVGSEGCFGVALDVTVRLTPNPAAIRTLLADFTTINDAARTTSAIVASGIIPAACELMDRGTIEAVEASIYAAGYPADAAAVLLVEVDGGEAAVADEAALVDRICRAHGARSVRLAIDPADRARLWQGRKKAFGAMGRVAPHLVVQDAVVPRTQLARILAAIAMIAERHGVRVCNVFHAGDGNLHPNIPYNGRDASEVTRVHAAMREIMSACIASGGTITGEHGVGLDKLEYMEQLFTPDTLDAMCSLRDAFDPERRANPGKVVPVRSCREWTGHAGTHGKGTEGTERTERSVQSASSVPSVSTASSASGKAPPVSATDQAIIDAIIEAKRNNTHVYIAGARTRIATLPGDAMVIRAGQRDVIDYVPGDLTISVGAGMTLAQLDIVTREHAQWCPLLPWGSDDSTIGGTLASAAAGPASGALGAPRDLTLGFTFVDGRGRVVNAGGRVVKNVAGFDLTRTVIGSWGTLGAITAVHLRLRARPPARETWALAVNTVSADAFDAAIRGPATPIAHVRVDSARARSLGLTDEPHHVVWIAGGAAHVAAARAVLLSLGLAVQLEDDVWRTIRSWGPGTPAAAPVAMGEPLARLNARISAAFDPGHVFVSPRIARASGAINANGHG